MLWVDKTLQSCAADEGAPACDDGSRVKKSVYPSAGLTAQIQQPSSIIKKKKGLVLVCLYNFYCFQEPF